MKRLSVITMWQGEESLKAESGSCKCPERRACLPCLSPPPAPFSQCATKSERIPVSEAKIVPVIRFEWQRKPQRPGCALTFMRFCPDLCAFLAFLSHPGRNLMQRSPNIGQRTRPEPPVYPHIPWPPARNSCCMQARLRGLQNWHAAC